MKYESKAAGERIFTRGTIVSLIHMIMNTFNNVNQLFNSPFPIIPNQHFG